mmetsp:Transcript_2956/g.9998  ORF Transcript_2956/g.9998 Transcript_2956/m.9998 type:complete len:275 (+) Transcript_2956:348-1172(+)
MNGWAITGTPPYPPPGCCNKREKKRPSRRIRTATMPACAAARPRPRRPPATSAGYPLCPEPFFGRSAPPRRGQRCGGHPHGIALAETASGPPRRPRRRPCRRTAPRRRPVCTRAAHRLRPRAAASLGGAPRSGVPVRRSGRSGGAGATRAGAGRGRGPPPAPHPTPPAPRPLASAARRWRRSPEGCPHVPPAPPRACARCGRCAPPRPTAPRARHPAPQSAAGRPCRYRGRSSTGAAPDGCWYRRTRGGNTRATPAAGEGRRPRLRTRGCLCCG